MPCETPFFDKFECFVTKEGFTLLSPKLYFKIKSTDPITSKRSLIGNRRFSSQFVAHQLALIVVQAFQAINTSSAFLKPMYHLQTFFCGMDLPQAFCNIQYIFLTDISFRKENLIVLLCTTKLDIAKI